MRQALGHARRFLFEGKPYRAFLEMASRQYLARPEGECPCCGYRGQFQLEAHLLMAESCPRCGALERQRLFALAVQRGFLSFAAVDVLQFAPDPSVTALVEAQSPASHVTADYEPGRAQLRLNIEQLALADGSFDRIVCSHVLEHVDDRKALAELYRVLRPGGQTAIMLPVVEGWTHSYENANVNTVTDRILHFGQWDHVRFFGADVRARIAVAGFALDEFTASGEDAVTHRLLRGEKVFRATKAATVRPALGG